MHFIHKNTTEACTCLPLHENEYRRLSLHENEYRHLPLHKNEYKRLTLHGAKYRRLPFISFLQCMTSAVDITIEAIFHECLAMQKFINKKCVDRRPCYFAY
jgi:hypothetical protein